MQLLDGELATWEMDFSDEEPELPGEVDAELVTLEMEDLIQRLEGKGEPLTKLPHLIRVCEGFFPDSTSLSTIISWPSQLRHRVLKAIGNCNTLEFLRVGEICGEDILRLTASEWEVVLRGFKSSTVLREISVSHLRWSSDTEVKSFCLQLGGIVTLKSKKTRNLVPIKIVDCVAKENSGLSVT
ncbi:hypothetical protein AXG93_4698s1270 [Marchantia polymorpha subsp. ruderalis]|uniref:FBD domain-containing protein n=1 Tax=Marchantia polymorpha subsp. ruderalis TaxID=1480154 RepID=A0A176VIS3_MARPO|nr:hypothetical protein AXG93_4698s1270 [Marchantia polymorpha subsp. ruderalis]